jgi:hypothetical protein
MMAGWETNEMQFHAAERCTWGGQEPCVLWGIFSQLTPLLLVN